jgi:hypothetical protein
MIKPRSKNEILSDSTRTTLDTIFICELFNRTKLTFSKEMTKGTIMESKSLELYEQAVGEKYFKNNQILENEWLVGIPDVITNDRIIDIKTSWDHISFARTNEAKAKKLYYWQLVGYCLLTGKTQAEIAHCLVNTPDDLIESELYKLDKYIPNLSTDDAVLEDVKRNFIFDDIPAKYRVHRTCFEVLEGDMEKIKERVTLWREYLNQKLKELS